MAHSLGSHKLGVGTPGGGDQGVGTPGVGTKGTRFSGKSSANMKYYFRLAPYVIGVEEFH